ncbi:rapid alkalinization factor [Cornus florida]|uniref:rapid alkalinization factor n=1 Tax=Cornus florida TaxID=4283 RepID=UPI00289C37EE|nr:rapid alkalinization factor [Cornus florida]
MQFFSSFAQAKMSKIFIALCFITTLIISSSPSSHTVDASSGGHQTHLGWLPTTRSGCRGSLAECLAAGEDDEFELDSEINRRILATTRYISYGALQRNSVPCSRRGASYYNCRPGAQANPYTRGCSAITHCRR